MSPLLSLDKPHKFFFQCCCPGGSPFIAVAWPLVVAVVEVEEVCLNLGGFSTTSSSSGRSITIVQ